MRKRPLTWEMGNLHLLSVSFIECPKDTIPGKRSFRCKAPIESKSQEHFEHCITAEHFCDGVPDCHGGIDEMQDHCFYLHPVRKMQV